MDIIEEADELIYAWILTLPIEEIREVNSATDVLNSLNEEAEEEIKERLWQLIKNSIHYNTILMELKLFLHNEVKPASDSSSASDSD